jgi:hypothetical protein
MIAAVRPLKNGDEKWVRVHFSRFWSEGGYPARSLTAPKPLEIPHDSSFILH